MYQKLIELNDTDLFNEIKTNPGEYLQATHSHELRDFLFVCSQLDKERWSYSYGDDVEHEIDYLDYTQSEEWWNEMDRSDADFHLRQNFISLPSQEWVNEKIKQM